MANPRITHDDDHDHPDHGGAIINWRPQKLPQWIPFGHQADEDRLEYLRSSHGKVAATKPPDRPKSPGSPAERFAAFTADIAEALNNYNEALDVWRGCEEERQNFLTTHEVAAKAALNQHLQRLRNSPKGKARRQPSPKLPPVDLQKLKQLETACDEALKEYKRVVGVFKDLATSNDLVDTSKHGEFLLEVVEYHGFALSARIMAHPKPDDAKLRGDVGILYSHSKSSVWVDPKFSGA